MQRPGQPPQRTTSIAPAQFRQTFTGYAMPTRTNSTTPFPANLQRNQSTGSQTHTGQNSFMQPRQTPFAFGGAQQSSSQLQPVPLTPTLPSTPAASLDEFPALGSTPANNANQSSTTISYASQAGTGLLPGASGTATTPVTAASRDFTPDDFPALSAQPNTTDGHSHPPGLNGFQHNSLTPLQPPGMLSLTPTQARSIHPGFQGGQADTEKQQPRNNYPLKMGQAAWNSPTLTQSTPAASNGTTAGFLNGTHSPSVLTGPPGATAPSNTTAPYTASTTFSSNGLAPGEPSNNASPPEPPNSLADGQRQPQSNQLQHPETPAQQILMSAADRWGLLGLLAMIKNSGSGGDQGLSSVGTDLSVMGLDMGHPGDLYSSFITPWSDPSALDSVEPEFHLPACYNVQPPPPGPNKAAAFSDETLFFMFFSSPRDALQEVAAQELFSRNWRYHKELRMWITKESGSSISRKIVGGEEGHYTVWDHDIWAKEGKEMRVLYEELEEKNVPHFQQGPGFVPVQGQAQTQLQLPAQQQQPTQLAQRASFQM